MLQEAENVGQITKAVIKSFVASSSLLEPKIYLILELVEVMKYEQLNAILSSLEDRYSSIAKDGSNALLLNNLNPIKTACHLLILLKRIEGRYSLTKLRTAALSGIIIARARSVLDHLFFPLQMKY